MAEVEELIQSLEDENPEIRIRSIRRLGRLNDERAVLALIGMLSDPDEEVLKYTCRALGKTRDERVVLPLIKFIETSESNEEYIDIAISALGRIGDKRAIEPLIGMLKDSERRLCSAKALGGMRTEKSIEALIEVLQSESAEEGKIAVNGLYGSIKHGDEYYQKVLEICSDVERCTTASRYLLDLINRNAGIHPDGSVAFSETPPTIIEPTEREVFYDPESHDYFYIDEDGNEVDCDLMGRDLN